MKQGMLNLNLSSCLQPQTSDLQHSSPLNLNLSLNLPDTPQPFFPTRHFLLTTFHPSRAFLASPACRACNCAIQLWKPAESDKFLPNWDGKTAKQIVETLEQVRSCFPLSDTSKLLENKIVSDNVKKINAHGKEYCRPLPCILL